MQYCPKCGYKVDDTMTFCPNCATRLKGAAPSQAPSAEPIKGQVKADHDFVYFLASGSILIVIAVFAILELTSAALMSGQYLVIMLVIIGLIIVLAAVYMVFSGRKSLSSKLLSEPEEKQPITPMP